MAKIKCVVTHPNLHLAVAGKLQQMKKDSTITVEEKHVQRHLKNGALKRFDDKAAVDVGGAGTDDAELKALRERAAELNITNASKMKADTLKTKIAEAEAAIAEANAAAGQQ